MNKQTINLTLFSDSIDYECLKSSLKIEASIITSNYPDGEEHISKELKGFECEALFSIIKDIMIIEIEKSDKDGK